MKKLRRAACGHYISRLRLSEFRHLSGLTYGPHALVGPMRSGYHIHLPDGRWIIYAELPIKDDEEISDEEIIKIFVAELDATGVKIER